MPSTSKSRSNETGGRGLPLPAGSGLSEGLVTVLSLEEPDAVESDVWRDSDGSRLGR